VPVDYEFTNTLRLSIDSAERNSTVSTICTSSPADLYSYIMEQRYCMHISSKLYGE
jgi:hypothetical protein